VIVNNENKLKGVVSDGDIRRSILKGIDISQSISLIMNKNPLVIEILEDNENESDIIYQIKSTIITNEFKKKLISKKLINDLVFIPIIYKESLKLLGIIPLNVIYKENRFKVFIQKSEKIEKPVKNVLVIGGGGYIGSRLVFLLSKNNYNVRVLDNFIWEKSLIKKFEEFNNIEVIVGDILDESIILESLKDIDAVCHLAAIVGDPSCGLDFKMTMATNYLSTVTIANACKYLQINRFIFASTCSVYGASDKDILLNEESELNPVSTYARTKLEAENAILSMIDGNFLPTILRKATVFGYSDRMRFDLLINLLTAKAYYKNEITIFGGKQWRPFIHCDDVALAYLKVLESPIEKVGGQIFNVGKNSENYTIEAIGNIIKKCIPDAEIIVYEDIRDNRNYRVDFSKAKKVLNFNPNWTVELGVKQLIEKFKQGKFKNWEDPKYNNYLTYKKITSEKEFE
ncbi:MAG: NAD-dependent epimerase/dehydratase family protein, partial [Promethearchaeia archaeon]